MGDFKSVQDLIVRAAMYDGITTTIRRNELLGGIEVVEIVFSKGGRHCATNIDFSRIDSISEEMALYSCKSTLRKLLWAPYEEIKENEYECTQTNNYQTENYHHRLWI